MQSTVQSGCWCCKLATGTHSTVVCSTTVALHLGNSRPVHVSGIPRQPAIAALGCCLRLAVLLNDYSGSKGIELMFSVRG